LKKNRNREEEEEAEKGAIGEAVGRPPPFSALHTCRVAGGGGGEMVPSKVIMKGREKKVAGARVVSGSRLSARHRQKAGEQ